MNYETYNSLFYAPFDSQFETFFMRSKIEDRAKQFNMFNYQLLKLRLKKDFFTFDICSDRTFNIGLNKDGHRIEKLRWFDPNGGDELTFTETFQIYKNFHGYFSTVCPDLFKRRNVEDHNKIQWFEK